MYFLRRQTPRKTRVENPYRSLHRRPPARLSAPPLSSRQPGGYCKRGRNVEQFFAARQRELRKATGDARSSSRISVYGKDELAAIRRFPRHVPYAQKQRLDKPVDLRIFPLCKNTAQRHLRTAPALYPGMSANSPRSRKAMQSSTRQYQLLVAHVALRDKCRCKGNAIRTSPA